MKRELREAIKLEKERNQTPATNNNKKEKSKSKILLALGIILSITAGGLLSKRFLLKK